MRSGGRGAGNVVDANNAVSASDDATAFGTILDEILQDRNSVHLLVAFVQIKGTTKLLSGIEFVEGRLGDEDGGGSFQAKKVEKLLDEAEQKSTVGGGKETVKGRV